MKTKKRLQATDRRQEIVQSALKVFARKGFAGATTREIAEAAGVSEALLYRHFASKEMIYRELASVLGRNAERFKQVLSAVPPSPYGFIRAFYFLGRYMLIGRPGAPKEDSIDRLMGYSLLEDGSFARAFLENLFYPIVPYLEACLVTLTPPDRDVPTSPGSFECILLHHLMGMIAIFLLPSEPVMPETDRQILLERVLTFGLRGMGFSQSALTEYLDFGRLDTEFFHLHSHEAQNEKPEHRS
jgi:AcrR family transcriptional regulator